MRAVAIVPGSGKPEIIDAPQPTVQQPGQALVKIVRVGVCGTDRELVAGEIGEAPPEQKRLVIGHEMLGRIESLGSGAAGLKAGELVVATVRRGCGRCPSCQLGDVDFCATGGYVEHGIKQLDGFMAEYVVDDARFLVPVPEELEAVGVLLEPLSVGEKALEQCLAILRRLPVPPGQVDLAWDGAWAKGLRALVAGSGPIGMLGAMILRAHGAEVIVADRSPDDTTAAGLIRRIGAQHLNSKGMAPDKIAKDLGPIDLIFEATGAAAFSWGLIDALGANGVCVLTGIPGGDKREELPAAALMRRLVLNNQAIVGSVNASRRSFERGVGDLARFRELWGDAVDQLITERVPLEKFLEAIDPPGAGGIKSVVELGG
ncbi:MAG TPA: glucose 1-dehydrogenase [Herpetosiphonaceae bacterium]